MNKNTLSNKIDNFTELAHFNNGANRHDEIRHNHMDTAIKNKIFNLLEKYSPMIRRWNEPLKATDLLKHEINLKTDNPISTRNYCYPIHFRDKVKDEIDKLIKANIIR